MQTWTVVLHARSGRTNDSVEEKVSNERVTKARDQNKRSISPECNQRLEIEPENDRGETKTGR